MKSSTGSRRGTTDKIPRPDRLAAARERQNDVSIQTGVAARGRVSGLLLVLPQNHQWCAVSKSVAFGPHKDGGVRSGAGGVGEHSPGYIRGCEIDAAVRFHRSLLSTMGANQQTQCGER